MSNFSFNTTALSGVVKVTTTSHKDDRGSLSVVFDGVIFGTLIIKQVNYVHTKAGALRGLHYQVNTPQAKLVKVLSGHIYDVCVDLRKKSESYGRWAGFHLMNPDEMLYVPHGIAHGFYALTDATVMYFMDDYYSKDNERVLYWDDPKLAIDWPLINFQEPALSERDDNAPCFGEIEKFG